MRTVSVNPIFFAEFAEGIDGWRPLRMRRGGLGVGSTKNGINMLVMSLNASISPQLDEAEDVQ